MVALTALVEYTDQLLRVSSFDDYCPNGLQIEGRPTVGRIVSGVTACQALIDAAIDRQADLLLVHHGYFWKGEAQPITGIKRRRIGALLAAGVGLLAYHLPLDAHPVLGNNARLAALLGFSVEAPLTREEIGCVGHPEAPLSAAQLAARIATVLGREPLLIAGGDHEIRRVAWCTGAAQGYIERAAELGADAYVSGEISEQTVHLARELGIHYFAAGHHATERYGVQALGDALVQTFGVEHEFIDIDNPV